MVMRDDPHAVVLPTVIEKMADHKQDKALARET